MNKKHEEIIQTIQEYGKNQTKQQQTITQLEQQLKEYFKEEPTKITILEEYIKIQIPPEHITNRTIDKLEKITYTKDQDTLIIPIPKTLG